MKKQWCTRTSIARQMQGARPLGPGAYVDRTGALHFSVPEVLAFLNVADTPENRARATTMLAELLEAECPEAEVIEQDLKTDG